MSFSVEQKESQDLPSEVRETLIRLICKNNGMKQSDIFDDKPLFFCLMSHDFVSSFLKYSDEESTRLLIDNLDLIKKWLADNFVNLSHYTEAISLYEDIGDFDAIRKLLSVASFQINTRYVLELVMKYIPSEQRKKFLSDHSYEWDYDCFFPPVDHCFPEIAFDFG